MYQRKVRVTLSAAEAEALSLAAAHGRTTLFGAEVAALKRAEAKLLQARADTFQAMRDKEATRGQNPPSPTWFTGRPNSQ